MKKFIKINFIILVIFFIFCNFTLQPIIATEDVEENIDNNEENNEEQVEEEPEEKTLDDLQVEKSDLENQLNNSNAQIEFIESDLSATVAEIATINQQILDKDMEIKTLQAQEGELVAYLDKAKSELEESTDRYERQKDLLEKRLVAMYEMGQTTYLDVLLSSKGITDFLSNYYLISEITAADTELLNTVEAEKKYNKKLKEALETKQATLIASRETREKNAILLENMSVIKNNKISQLTEEELELERAVEEYQKQIADIETEIRLLAIANVGSEYVGGTMAWPVPGYTRITSPFGMRTHPITGVYKLHTGTDIGAPMGATFVAANDGLVTYAGWNNAYGNMVIVDHGGGITTLYAHGSKILVSVGDKVFQNTPVLNVGSTGYSTGPHAHFEVRINGEYVQPLDYITSYSKPNEVEEQEEKIETKEEDSEELPAELNLDTSDEVQEDEVDDTTASSLLFDMFSFEE